MNKLAVMKTGISCAALGIMLVGLTGCGTASADEATRLTNLMTDSICLMNTEFKSVMEMSEVDLAALSPEQLAAKQQELQSKGAAVEEQLRTLSQTNGFENDAAVESAIGRLQDKEAFQRVVGERVKSKCQASEDVITGAFSGMFQ